MERTTERYQKVNNLASQFAASAPTDDLSKLMHWFFEMPRKRVGPPL